MATDPLPAYLQSYLDNLVPARPAELQAMEAYADRHGFPIIGPASGYACYQIACMIGARRIFELGSGYGYSTAWFAMAVRENLAQSGTSDDGSVHHVVWDEKLSQMARGHMDRLGLAGLVRYSVGEAVEALRAAEGPFDLIFNDIDKEGYPASLPVIAEKLRPGGVLIIDNMLWHGAIFDSADQSPATRGVHEITRLLTTDTGWITTLLPIRDGMIVAYRR